MAIDSLRNWVGETLKPDVAAVQRESYDVRSNELNGIKREVGKKRQVFSAASELLQYRDNTPKPIGNFIEANAHLLGHDISRHAAALNQDEKALGEQLSLTRDKSRAMKRTETAAVTTNQLLSELRELALTPDKLWDQVETTCNALWSLLQSVPILKSIDGFKHIDRKLVGQLQDEVYDRATSAQLDALSAIPAGADFEKALAKIRYHATPAQMGTLVQRLAGLDPERLEKVPLAKTFGLDYFSDKPRRWDQSDLEPVRKIAADKGPASVLARQIIAAVEQP